MKKRPFIKIVLAVPRPEDPTSFYRAFGPLQELRLKSMMGDNPIIVEYLMPSSFSWATLALADICFIQRPSDPSVLQIANIAKITRVPLWVDFDDDNLAVPKDNETYHAHFGRWDVKDAITKVARMADVVTVSTEYLKKRYRPYNENIVVVPNAIDDRYLYMRRDMAHKRGRDKVIGWRGGPGFKENIAEISENVINVAKRNPAWKFIFMGYEPIHWTESIKNHQWVPWIDGYLDYIAALFQIHATSFFYNIKFNHHSLSRSHGAWLEATFSGAAMLAKKSDEFIRPGCINYETPAQFEEKLEAIIRGEINTARHVEESWEHIRENYLLTKVNKKRLEIIETLISRGNPYELVAA